MNTNLHKFQQRLFEHIQVHEEVLEPRINHQQLYKSRFELTQNADRNTVKIDGFARLDKMRKQFDNFKLNGKILKRWTNQIIFCDAVMEACLPIIFGSEWDNCSTRVMKQESLDRIRSYVAILCARQFGKSTALQICIANLLLHVPGVLLLLFSISNEQAQFFLTNVAKMIEALDGGHQRIVGQNKRHLHISEQPLPPGKSRDSAIADEIRHLPTTSQLICFGDVTDDPDIENKKK